MTIDMWTERTGEAVVMGTLQGMDEGAFAALAERHRRELHVHCYRMLGSFDEAEDAGAGDVPAGVAQPRDLRGRRRVPRLAVPDRHQRLPRRDPRSAAARPSLRSFAEVPWLQPYPDRLLDEVAADGATSRTRWSSRARRSSSPSSPRSSSCRRASAPR